MATPRRLVAAIGATPEAARAAIEAAGSSSVEGLEFPEVVTEATGTRTVTDADNGRTILFTAVGGCVVTIDSANSVGMSCTLVQMPGAGTVELDDDGGSTTFVAPASAADPPATLEAGTTIGIQMVDAATALVFGSLAAA